MRLLSKSLPFLLAGIIFIHAFQIGITSGWAEDGSDDLPPSSECPYTIENPVDLNRASPDALRLLPLDEKDIETILFHRTYISYFKSIYDLLQLPNFDQEKFERIKPVVFVEYPEKENEILRRLDDLYYKIQGWARSEGTNEALIDLWIDIAKIPINVNDASVEDLSNLQNVSPIDAVAIVKYRNARGRISSQRSLRDAPGLTNWGYRNARNFLNYAQEEHGVMDVHGSYQFRIYNSPYDADIEELLREDVDNTDDREPFPDQRVVNWWDRLGMDSAVPARTQKLTLHFGRHYHLGMIHHQNLGYEREDDSLTEYVKESKAYLGLESFHAGRLRLQKMIVGHYNLAFGQGLVMENTDFFKPRKTGYSYDKRYLGVLGDISRNEEYKLMGIACQSMLELDSVAFLPPHCRVQSIVFYSDDKKDAILKDNGDALSYVILTPRVSNDMLETYGLEPMLDVVHERMYGGNIRFEFMPGCWIGLSGWEALYDRFFSPDYDTLQIIAQDSRDKLTDADSEFFSMYHGKGKYRRVWGGEYQMVFGNTVLQGEYGKLDGGGQAFIGNLFHQYNDLNLLLLYRNYDLDYDNPYCRAFSNYERYRGTILEDQYYLGDPLYGFLHDNAVQPQSEEGVFVSSRYRISEKLTPSFEYDIWRRKSDGARYQRFTGRLEYRPIFPLRFGIRHRYLSRNPENHLTLVRFRSMEDRLRVDFRLSNYDRIRLLYSTSYTRWPPRGRLSDNKAPDGGHPLQGNNSEPSDALYCEFIHNVNTKLKFSGGFCMFDGFFWNFEDSEFVVLDGEGLRYWFSISDRITDHLSLYGKVTWDQGAHRTYCDVRKYNEDDEEFSSSWNDAPFVERSNFSYRLQIDYMW
jgi:DNA uptake protein ComE-like DNA-binding protein